MAGLGGRLLNSTFEVLTKEGLNAFLITWKSFEMPSTWSRQQNPITHRQSYFMSDILRLTMIFPFLLMRFLSIEVVKSEVLQALKQRNSLNRRSQSITMIMQCWISFATLAKLIFTSTLQDSDYTNLTRLSNDFTSIVLKVMI